MEFIGGPSRVWRLSNYSHDIWREISLESVKDTFWSSIWVNSLASLYPTLGHLYVSLASAPVEHPSKACTQGDAPPHPLPAPSSVCWGVSVRGVCLLQLGQRPHDLSERSLELAARLRFARDLHNAMVSSTREVQAVCWFCCVR